MVMSVAGTREFNVPSLIGKRKRETIVACVCVDPFLGGWREEFQIGGIAVVVLRLPRRSDPLAGLSLAAVFGESFLPQALLDLRGSIAGRDSKLHIRRGVLQHASKGLLEWVGHTRKTVRTSSSAALRVGREVESHIGSPMEEAPILRMGLGAFSLRAMKQPDPDQIVVPVDRKDVLAVCVMPDGKKLLWVRQPIWLTIYMLGCAGFLIWLGLAATDWDWSQLILLLPGACAAFLAIQHFPRAFLNDPAKPHHWVKRYRETPKA